MRIVLYLGKGGVGKTTVSAASAVRAAELGHRTLVVSTDIAHSLSDALDRTLGDDPIELRPGLWAQEINVLAEMRRHWQTLRPVVSEALAEDGIDSVAAEELAIVPGMDEIVALLRIQQMSEEGGYDAVFVDAAPTGETIRLLSMPESVPWYLDRLKRWGKRIPRLARPLTKGVTGEGGLLEFSDKLSESVKRLRSVLIDQAVTGYRLVVTPERMVVKEALRAQTYLNLFGYPIDAVVLNQVLPESASGGEYLEAMKAQQRRYVQWVEDSFRPLPILRAERSSTEVIGPAALSGLARQVFRDGDPTAVLHTGPTQVIEPIEGGYRLRIPMPNVEAQRLAMSKKGDELHVEIGNIRREIALPRVLAPLEAGGARLNGGFLEIRFALPAGAREPAGAAN